MTALELLSQPGVWQKNRMASDEDGMGVSPHDSDARHFCLLGAVEKVYKDKTWTPLIKTSAAIEKLFPKRLYALTGDERINLHSFNDKPETTFKDVLAVLEEAGV